MTSNDKSKLSRLVNKIRAAQVAMAEAQEIIDNSMPDLEAAMKDAGLDFYSTDHGKAFFKEQKGRVTNKIDVRAYAEAVDEDEFYESVSVSVTKAKDYLPKKALDKITTRIEPAPKDPKLVVEGGDK